jgi:hypothetical protein
MNIKRFFALSFFALVLAAACTQSGTETLDAVPENDTVFSQTVMTATDSPTPAPIPTQTVTPLPTEPEIEPQPTATATQEPQVEEIPVCISRPSTPEEAFHFQGSLLYFDPSQETSFSIDSTLTISERPDLYFSEYDFPRFSPDGQWAAFIEDVHVNYGEDLPAISFFLLSSSGERIDHKLDLTGFLEQVPIDLYLSGTGAPHYWINDQFIYVTLWMSTLPVGSQNIYPLVKLLDPFSGVWREDLLEDIPYFTPVRESSNAPIRYMAGFSPDLTRLLYEYRNPQTFKGSVVLWDMVEKQVIWSDRKLEIPDGVVVSWSPDSLIVAYTAYNVPPRMDHRIFMLDRVGTSGNALPSPPYSPSDLLLYNLDWSPDSRYLPLNNFDFISRGFSSAPTVFIYDRLEDRYILECPIGNIGDLPGWIVWSQESRYLFTSNRYEGKLMVIDLLQRQVFSLGLAGYPLAWLPDEWLP